MYTTFRHELTDTYDIVRIDDLGLQTVVGDGKEPRFRSTVRLLLINMKILQLNTHGRHIVLYAAVKRTRVLIDL